MMRDERNEDKPPYSRIFVVCDRQLRQEDLKSIFDKYGDIESLYVPKDRNTGETKGIAYIKYTKTTSAAAAIDALHMKYIQSNSKPLKVMVATTKSEERSDNENKYKRLFIKVPRESTEGDIKEYFSKFGHVSNVHMQRDKETNENRGFAYVQFNTFCDAAKAFEECDKMYKPVFATPKEELKRTRKNFEIYDRPHESIPLWEQSFGSNSQSFGSSIRDPRHHIDNHTRECNLRDNKETILPMIKTTPGDFDTIKVLCDPFVPQKPIQMLFNIIPGMIHFKYTPNSTHGGVSMAIVKYESKVAAAHALASLNNYEFPSGQVITVKPEYVLNNVANSLSQIVNSFKNSLDSNLDLLQLADAISQASTLLKAATSSGSDKTDRNDSFCSVPLPSPKPRADLNAKVAQRCFIVFKPHPLPKSVLEDIFCRFGNLIDVNTVHNKTYGFVKFSSAKSAYDAMETLHNATVYGVHLKVLEAEEMKKNKEKMHVEDNEIEENDDIKRARMDE